MYTKKILVWFAAVVFMLVPTSRVFANDPAPVAINLKVVGPTSIIFDGAVTVPACTTPNNATSTVNGFCAFDAAAIAIDATWMSFGALVNSIGGVSGDVDNFWLWFLNGDAAQVGIDSYILQPGDTVLWTLGRQPLKVTVSNTSPEVGATTTVNVLGFNAINFGFEPVSGATIVGTTVVTDASGNAEIFATSTNPLAISVTATGFIDSEVFSISPQPNTIILTIRNGGSTAFTGTINLPDPGAPDVVVAPTTGDGVSVPARSLLSVLTTLDATSDAFDITDLSYSESFASFLINCIATPPSAAPSCYNWTTAINGVYPQVGVDDQLLADGDVAYLFFGPSHQTSLSTSSVISGESFTATAEQYDLTSGTYVSLTGVTLGVGTANPDFSFTELATSTVDAGGQAVFTITATSTYSVGIKEDFYFPAATVTIIDAPVVDPEPESDPTPAPTPTGGGSSGIFLPPTHAKLDVARAVTFLVSKQKADGSFGSSLYTDWAVIALAATGETTGASARVLHLTTVHPSLTLATDYIRHAMALMSAGINPYSGTSVNYIQKIVATFDGTQIGEAAIVNDDIFALFPLLKAGHTTDESMIQKIVAFIVSKQRSNGSWENSIDVTAAAVQALTLTPLLPQVGSTINVAKAYLKNSQQVGGGYGTSFSTSWTMQAIAALGENTNSWLKNDKSPEDSLASLQQADGGVEPISAAESTRIWATSYAIPAALHKPWAAILQSFPKPVVSTNIASGGSSASAPATATSTAITATSTVVIASTTPIATSTNPSPALPQGEGATTTVAIPDDSLLRAPEESPLEKSPTPKPNNPTRLQSKKPIAVITAPQAPVTPTFVSPINPKVGEQVTKVLPPMASVGGLIPNTPTARTATTFSLLGAILLVIVLL